MDVRKKLVEKYKDDNRYRNFGSVVKSVDVRGFRGVSTNIQFDYPVTAISGLNGSGKSTVGQLLLCGYRKISTSISGKRFYVKDFFPVSALDPTPFSDDASINFKYQTDKLDVFQEVTISRTQKEWSGYKRQPERNCEYVGFTVYIPKVERRDLSIYSASKFTLGEKSVIEDGAKYVSRILGSPYNDIHFQGIVAGTRSAELGIASRFGAKYSENNMGFGEGRVVYTVRLLEGCPEQSLIVLEEPETSLHENAQYEFIKYLMDVANRRHHQIVFSTHSSIMMDALPPEGRKMLMRSQDGVTVYDRVTSTRVKTALSAGESGHTIICVEDEFAQSMLREILRRLDKQLLQSVEIIPFGDSKAVISAQNVLNKAGKTAISVRDADVGQDKAKKVFSLPGALPPEKEVFLSAAGKKCLKDHYDFDFDALLAANPDMDHHHYAKHVAEKLSCSREVLEADCIRAFLDDKPADWASQLCADIGSSLR